MNHLCDIEEKTQTQDSVTGEVTDTWAVKCSDIYCDIEALSVKDYLQSMADQSEISVRITLPYLTDIDPKNRIVGKCGCHCGKIYNPKGILEDNITGQEYLTIPCSQGVNSG